MTSTPSSGGARRRTGGTAVLLLLALVLTGCAQFAPRDLQPPTVNMAALELAELGLRAQRFRLTLELDNPNTVALPVNRLDYDIALDGHPLASGYSEQAFRVPANGRERVTLVVSTDLLSSANRMVTLLQRGERSVDYDLNGRVRLDLPFRPALNFNDSGEVLLQR